MTTEQFTGPKDRTTLPAHRNGQAAAEPPPPPPVLPIDVAKLTDEQLTALLAEAQRELERRKERLRDQARALGLKLASDTAHDRRHDVKPLLWNPKDHSQRWSKRGAAPKWYVDHIAAGGTEEECVIPEGAL
jgi:hypothetical protein